MPELADLNAAPARRACFAAPDQGTRSSAMAFYTALPRRRETRGGPRLGYLQRETGFRNRIIERRHVV